MFSPNQATLHDFLEADSPLEITREFASLMASLQSSSSSSSSSTPPDPVEAPPRFPYQAIRSKAPSAAPSPDLWDTLDAKLAELKEHAPKGSPKRVVISGAGIAGLRTAIQLLLLGDDVTLVEKRTVFSRHNIIRLWPSTIHDLKSVGVKVVFRKFCFGGVEHVGIGTLQASLLKVALLLGAKIHLGSCLSDVMESEAGDTHWRAAVIPARKKGPEASKQAAQTPPLQAAPVLLKANVVIGAEGERSFISDRFEFVKKESRAGEAIGITANFLNHHTQEEEALPEQSVTYYFNQGLFKDLEQVCGLKLENLVYFRGITHYFVITAKRDSLLDAHVLLENHKEIKEVVAPGNINRAALEGVMKKLAVFCGLKEESLTYAVDHQLRNDVQLFDFSTKHQCELPAKVISHNAAGQRVPGLFVSLVGDSLVAPFWPQGTGGNRAVLSALDTAWAIHNLRPEWLASVDENEIPGNDEHLQEILKTRLEAYTLMLTSGPETLIVSSLSHFDPTKRYKRGGIALM